MLMLTFPMYAIVTSGSVEVFAVTSSQHVGVTLFNGSSQVATGSLALLALSGTRQRLTQGLLPKYEFARTGRAPEFNAVRVNGQILTDAAVGLNSFKLDFSDGAKDQSGLGNDWNALNLNLGGDFTYSSAHGSNVTTAEFAKMVDSDLNTYGEASGDFIGFAFAGEKITFKIQNTAQDAKLFYVQPATNTSFNFVNGGTWSVSGGVLVAISGHSMPTVQRRALLQCPATMLERVVFTSQETIQIFAFTTLVQRLTLQLRKTILSTLLSTGTKHRRALAASGGGTTAASTL